MIEQPLLLVSSYIPNAARLRRHPLERIVLPEETVAEYKYLPEGHVWWIEKHRQNLYLRAKLYIIAASLEQDLQSNKRQVIWHLDQIHTERITWPGSGYRRKGNVTSLLSSLLRSITNGFMLLPVPANLEHEFESQRLCISERVWQFKDAVHILHQLFRGSEYFLSLHGSTAFSFAQAWHHIHACFAREELISVCNYDAYDVAAAILSGCSSMPTEQNFPSRTVSFLSVAVRTDFQELDEEHLGYIEQHWVRKTETSTNWEALEDRTKRHQQIIKVLAQRLRIMGLCPTYNTHLDLRVERKSDEVFFEIKTTNAKNIDEQVRRAVGQLLEYRFRYKRRNDGISIRLVAVVEAGMSPDQYKFTQAFLADIGIVLVLCNPDNGSFEGLIEALV